MPPLPNLPIRHPTPIDLMHWLALKHRAKSFSLWLQLCSLCRTNRRRFANRAMVDKLV